MSPRAAATVEPRFGTTPRVPLTGFIVFGLLTFWVYTALELGRLVHAHLASRWAEIAALHPAAATGEAGEALRARGFDTKTRVPRLAAAAFALDGALVVGCFLAWIVLGFELRYPAVMGWVGAAAALFYGTTCALVIWIGRRLKAHEAVELAAREHGAAMAAARAVPDEAFVARWERNDGHVALFLVLALPLVAAPVLATHLFLQRPAAATSGILPVLCFVAGAAVHLWGTWLLLGLFNRHLATEAMHRGDGAAPTALVPAPPAGLEPYAGVEPFIFVSYKREDFDRIRPILERIGGWGYRLWYDKGIPGGAEWDALIEERLQACAMLLFFASRGSVESKYCRREIKYVDQLNKPLLSIRLEPVELRHGLEMLLTQYQMVDARAQDLTGEIERALTYMRLL